jgi:hypothetical protein
MQAECLACVCAHDALVVWDKLTVLCIYGLLFYWKVVAVGLKV